MKRALSVVGGIIFLAFLFLAGPAVYRGVTVFVRAVREGMKPLQLPKELQHAEIVQGGDRFSKKVYFAKADLGLITDFSLRPNDELEVIGQSGAALLTGRHSPSTVELSKTIYYEKCDSGVASASVGSGAYLCRGGWATGASLIGSDGKTLWSYGASMPGIDDATSGSLGPNAEKRIVVGLNGGGGVRLLDAAGKEVWKREDSNVWHVEIAHVGPNSNNAILHSNAGGQLTVRDADGNILGRYRPELYLSDFAMTSWQEDAEPMHLVASEAGFIYILASNGQTDAKLTAPGSPSLGGPKGTQVRFSGKAPYFAGLLRYSHWNRSLLYIYDAESHLIYHEILDERCDALQALPTANGKGELLVGCNGKVWRYSEVGER